MLAFHTPAVVQQKAEQAEQDESHASKYSQQKHGVVHADVLRKHRTWWTKKKLGKKRKGKSWAHKERRLGWVSYAMSILYILYVSTYMTCQNGFTVTIICVTVIPHLSVVGTWRPPSIPTEEQCRSDWAGCPPSAHDPSCSLSRHLHAHKQSLKSNFTTIITALMPPSETALATTGKACSKLPSHLH